MILNQTSIKRLVGVNPKLILIVNRALQICPLQLLVGEGVRTLETQREYVRKGLSQTMNSKHLTGHAVDMYALTSDGKLDGNYANILKVADSMIQASRELKIEIVWGGSWNQKILNNNKNANRLIEDYKAYKKSINSKPFYDTPHFEIDQKIYK